MNFTDLAHAVAFKNKPIGVFPAYPEERKSFDKILIDHALEKIDDPDQIRVWFFKPQNREDALARIAAIHAIDQVKQQRSFFTVEDHRAKGRTFGYSEDEIEGFLCRRTAMILRSFVLTGQAQFTSHPVREALPCPMSMGCHAL